MSFGSCAVGCMFGRLTYGTCDGVELSRVMEE